MVKICDNMTTFLRVWPILNGLFIVNVKDISYFNDPKRKIMNQNILQVLRFFSRKIVVITSILQLSWLKFYFKQRICRLVRKWQSTSLRKHRSFEIVLASLPVPREFDQTLSIDPIHEASRVFSFVALLWHHECLLDFELRIKKRVLNNS